ncbi:helix-turn-helix domain-containing protein [Aerococcus sanguinicola]|uniref:helix-turn-helix domain-containing protein n=1 Tax=unclassified Aerococcus TaxID=2618060 RepID=UPI0008A18334|nr:MULTISPECIES: helix-turn-helix transcriptional regulator [unclassified Aerococcus]MDK6856152.1 helix-turn-helix transcriptional regulator [Aerococcus sp. UMB7533]OFN02419.1 hypothetical protein HMPREF2626_06135 [Aerococcus sp. HMSC062A02]OHO45156.1 hypothetical protein HMPREF2705_01020 [Aerococcus sp. HMSC035B07]
MIRNRLSILMAERDLKIADMHELTGISKTTLTALADNKGKGVQYDTVDKICNVLGVTPSDFFAYEPYIFTFKRDEKGIILVVTTKEKTKAHYIDVSINLPDEYDFPLDNYLKYSLDVHITNELEDREEFYTMLDSLSTSFKTSILSKFIRLAKEMVKEKFEVGANNIAYFDIENRETKYKEVTLKKGDLILIQLFPWASDVVGTTDIEKTKIWKFE